MEKTSTSLARKSVRQQRPSRRVIDNILNYSKAMEIVANVYGKQIILINN